jgi:hypothetical protein
MAVYTAIDDPEAYFQTKLYTGNAGTLAITLDGDTDMQPDLVWGKGRAVATPNALFDSVRGATKYLEADRTVAEATVANSLTSFDSDGFTLGADTSTVINYSQLMVAWCWKESATAGFDIVTYTGTGSARTVSHSLSAVPHFLMVKKRNATGGWSTGHHSLGWTHEVQLQSTDAVGASTPAFNDTNPTSSVFTLGSGANGNSDTNTFVGYVFTGKQGFSKFGSYEGNGNADGTFIYTGFRPAMVIIKASSGYAGNWNIVDNKRLGYNSASSRLYPNTTATDDAGDYMDLLSNGFKPLISGNDLNGSGNTYIYMAFAEAPFVNSKGIPCNAR